MQVGFHSGRRYHAQLQEILPDENSQDSWSPNNILSFVGNDKSAIREHPIPKLMQEAEAKYKKKLGGQSKTLKDAVIEYIRRYRRPPPKGFDGWWNFTQANNVKMVDEFDGMIDDLKPFWSLSGEEIRRRSVQVGSLPSIDLVRIRNGAATIDNMHPDFHDTEISARSKGFRNMLTKYVKTVCHISTSSTGSSGKLHPAPRHGFPNQHQSRRKSASPLGTSNVSKSYIARLFTYVLLLYLSNLPIIIYFEVGVEAMLGGPFIADWGNDGTLWEAWRRTCTPQSSARRLFSSIRSPITVQVKNHFASSAVGPGSDFSFTKGTSSNQDFCDVPYIHYTQGHFFSDWRSIPALYPVFSPAKAQGFMDIKIPSHYYFGSTRRYTYGWDPINQELKDYDAMEVPWENKTDKVFWRGATTGGGSHPPGFSPLYQRHRCDLTFLFGNFSSSLT